MANHQNIIIASISTSIDAQHFTALAVHRSHKCMVCVCVCVYCSNVKFNRTCQWSSKWAKETQMITKHFEDERKCEAQLFPKCLSPRTQCESRWVVEVNTWHVVCGLSPRWMVGEGRGWTLGWWQGLWRCHGGTRVSMWSLESAVLSVASSFCRCRN